MKRSRWIFLAGIGVVLIGSGCLLCGGWIWDDNCVTGITASASDKRLIFGALDTQAAIVGLTVTLAEPAPKEIAFRLGVASDSEIPTKEVSFSHPDFRIGKGAVSCSGICLVRASAVEPDMKRILRLQFMPTDNRAETLFLNISVTKKSE